MGNQHKVERTVFTDLCQGLEARQGILTEGTCIRVPAYFYITVQTSFHILTNNLRCMKINIDIQGLQGMQKPSDHAGTVVRAGYSEDQVASIAGYGYEQVIRRTEIRKSLYIGKSFFRHFYRA